VTVNSVYKNSSSFVVNKVLKLSAAPVVKLSSFENQLVVWPIASLTHNKAAEKQKFDLQSLMSDVEDDE